MAITKCRIWVLPVNRLTGMTTCFLRSPARHPTRHNREAIMNTEREPTIHELDAIEDIELKVVTGGVVPVTRLFLQTHDKREAHNENVA
jgi:hypothetical protein